MRCRSHSTCLRLVLALGMGGGIATSRMAAAGAAPAGNPSRGATDTAITPVDNYEQWKSALDTGQGVTPPTFTLLPGFEIETLRTAQPDEGSWIAIAFDAKGRAMIARERRGLLWMNVSGGPLQVEVIDDTLEEVRGIVDTPHGLFANANVSRGLFRLRDTNGEGRINEITPLVKTKAGGHGRNAIALGPDGRLALIHGDAVDVPADVRRLTPPTVPALRPGDNLPHGHFLRTDPDGREWTLVASGLRNPVGVDFNPDGEAFTYDADAEMDMGMPWYRETHVRHLVSGADYGWRRVTGRWPPYYVDQPDIPPVTVPIGKGSPTAVKFGTRSHFPPLYQRALFILDWAYGRIVAVHLTPQGAGYTGRAESFLRGRPLNVTGIDFGPDGAMYFVTGGRNTQSGLYRVRYTGVPVAAPPTMAAERAQLAAAARARALRRELEAYHGRQDNRAITAAWPLLDYADPWIAHAARVALEHQPAAGWVSRALEEPVPARALIALLALTRVGPDEMLGPVLARLVDVAGMTPSDADARVFVRAAQYAVQRLPRIDPGARERLVGRLDALVPHANPQINREASRLLLHLEAESAVPKAVSLLMAARTQEEKLHYLHVLGRTRPGWTEPNRARFFRALAQTGSFRGGAGLPRFLTEIRNDALATVPETERTLFAAMLDAAPATSPPVLPELPSRPLVKQWTTADLAPHLADVSRGRNLARGKEMYTAGLCIVCHRFGNAGGAAGPDLTDVASRFSARDVLESILEPSRVVADTYRQVTLKTRGGATFTGRLVPVDYRLPVLRLADNPLVPENAVDVPKDEIVSYAESDISPMPPGLVDRLTRDEILDLLAYLEAGGP